MLVALLEKASGVKSIAQTLQLTNMFAADTGEHQEDRLLERFIAVEFC